MRYLNDLHALDLVLFFQWAIHAVVALVAVSVRSSLNTLNTWQMDYTEEVCKVYLFRSSLLHTCAGHFFAGLAAVSTMSIRSFVISQSGFSRRFR